MNSKFTLIITAMAFTILFASCSKNNFNERDAIAAQKDLLNLKYQHELDLETLKQKGATALQQLLNAAALQQLKLNDSLTTKNTINARKADYSIVVVDMLTNAPIADADVTVSSEGKIYSAKTSAQGVANFTSLYLFSTSSFLVSKAGYAATSILNQYLTAGAVKLWNTSTSSNEISGNLYIETDLTNNSPEKVGANVLITASTTVATNAYGGNYTVSFPSYTNADGAYSIKVPAAPNSYSLSFEQITADQKLYVNATDDDAITTFPNSLPRATTIKTYFNVNNFYAPVPAVFNYYYFKFSPDKTGRILYLPGYSTYYYNQIFASSTGDKYQIERLSTSNYNNAIYIDVNTYNYDANAKIDVQLVDVVGNIIQSAPQLAGLAGSNGKLLNYTSPENGNGYVHLKRNDAGVILNKGLLLRASVYDTYSNLYTLNFNTGLNTAANNRTVPTNYLLTNKGDKKVVNFYYGSGDSRAKQVY